jgi:hypothetical protein
MEGQAKPDTGGEFLGMDTFRHALPAMIELWMAVVLTDPGFDHTLLSEFRTRLVAGQAEQLLLETLLSQLRARGLLKARGWGRPRPRRV